MGRIWTVGYQPTISFGHSVPSKEPMPLNVSRSSKIRALRGEIYGLISTIERETKQRTTPNPYQFWMRDPRFQDKYIGQHVAIHPYRGVLAHAEYLPVVLRQLQKFGFEMDQCSEIAFAYIPKDPLMRLGVLFG